MVRCLRHCARWALSCWYTVACDYRECEWASPPANFIFHRGCGRRLATSQEWDLVIGSTDCTSIALCDTDADSRAS